MRQKVKIKVAGFGGQGVQLLGTVIAYTAMLEGKHVTFVPSYGPESRGGTSNCYITISDRAGESPLVDVPDVMITMNLPSLNKFEPTIRPGGLLIYNSSLTPRKPSRTDINIIELPATEIADQLGNTVVANMVVLGAFIERTQIISARTVMRRTLPTLFAKKRQLIPLNRRAIRAGIDWVRRAA
jgi:2-oxoglutarate ferredoxin oxidoreductase subunit gamma